MTTTKIHHHMRRACFTPNEGRMEELVALAKDMIEANRVEKVLEEHEIPLLKIETDYSQGDVSQLKTRIESFLEMVRARKKTA